MKSILQDKKECYVTGRTDGLHKHHIFGGPNRKISEREGFVIWLRPEWHTGDNGIHHNKEFALKVRRECQAKYEETHSREDFIKLIGRSYL